MDHSVFYSEAQKRVWRLQKVIRTALRLHSQSLKETHRAWLVTLTYRPDVDWSPRQITGTITKLRQLYNRRNWGIVPYVWVAELTKKGRMHYHLVVYVPLGHTLPHFDTSKLWQHGMTQVEPVRHHVATYLSKYLSKGLESNHFFPAGCRICSFGGLSAKDKDEMRYWRSPVWLRSRSDLPVNPSFRPVKQLGYVDTSTGILYSRNYGNSAVLFGSLVYVEN